MHWVRDEVLGEDQSTIRTGHAPQNPAVLSLRSFAVISDEGLKHLQDVGALQALDLMSTQVTDEGLKVLADMANLRLVMLLGARVTDMGVKGLQESRPEIQILYRPTGQ